MVKFLGRREIEEKIVKEPTAQITLAITMAMKHSTLICHPLTLK